MSDPRHYHLAAVFCILRYLRGTLGCGLFFLSSSPLYLIAHANANWAGYPDIRHSVTGWCMFLDTSLISWKKREKKKKKKKQDRVSKSSIEAEYQAMPSACFEILWLVQTTQGDGNKNSYPYSFQC